MFEEACQCMLSNRFQEAAELFATILRQDGEHPTIRYNAALALECSRQFQAAATEYEQVVQHAPEYARAYLGLSNCYLYLGDAEVSEEFARLAREKDPTDVQAALVLSEILCIRGGKERESEALHHHAEAVRLMDEFGSIPTQSHVLCYLDTGASPCKFHMFLEGSLLGRDAFPLVPPLSCGVPKEEETKQVFVADMQNVSEIAVALSKAGETRASIVVVTTDDLSGRILARWDPDVRLACPPYDANEFPAIVLHIAREVSRQGHAVRVSSSGGASEDAVTLPAHYTGSRLDPRLVPPLWCKGRHPPADAFRKLFGTVDLC